MTALAELRRSYARAVAGDAGARVVDAFATVPREDFVGPPPWPLLPGGGFGPVWSDDPRALYADVLVALAPERGINNGQPSLHAGCIDAAAVAPGDTVVHVGAGTGYYTAILALLAGPAGRVVAYECEADLAARAAAALRRYPWVEVRAEPATGRALPGADVVYVSAGASDIPAPWLDALNPGGRLVLPLTPDLGYGVMLVVTRVGAAAYAARALARVSFIACVGARDAAAAQSLGDALRTRPPASIRSLRRGTPPDRTAWCSGRGWWLSEAEPR